MNENILNTIDKKLNEAFPVVVPSRRRFEEDFKILSEELLKRSLPIVGKYEELKRAKKDYLEIIRPIAYTKENNSPKITTGFLEWKEYQKDYKELVKRKDERVVIPFSEFFKKRITELFPRIPETNESNSYEKIKGLLIEFIAEPDGSINNQRSFNSLEEILRSFKSNYEESHQMEMLLIDTVDNLLKISERRIKREDSFSFGNDWVVNIGERKYSFENHRLKNSYSVFASSKADKWYKYISNVDCRELDTKYVNIFLLTNKGYLIRITIGPDRVLQSTPYIIFKDIQKVNVVDDWVVEAHIHKHFEPEIIVFDTEDEAYKFQTKITSFRDGRRNLERRN